MIRVSIITINLNNKAGLEYTIDSVLAQDYPHIEYIVMDGASTDGSKELIESKAFGIAHWISEKDSGIYNAMNKGIREATGDYLLFLNSGDYLVDPHVISSSVKHFDTAAAVNYGDIVYFEEKGFYPVKNKPNPSLLLFRHNSIPHCTAFIRSDVFSRYGLYDESLKVISDWVLFMRLYLAQEKFHHFPIYIANFDLGGISTQGHQNDDFDRAMKRYFPNMGEDFEDLNRLLHYDISKAHRFIAFFVKIRGWFRPKRK